MSGVTGFWRKLQVALDRTESRWTLWLLVTGSGAMSSAVLTYFTDWLKAWGPIGWGIAIAGGVLVASAIFALLATAYARLIIGKRTAELIERGVVNPLDDHFERQKIRLIDFYQTDLLPRRNQTFKRCEISGPGLVYMQGMTALHCTTKFIQIVVVRTDVPVFGVTVFENVTFIDSVLSNFTMLMNEESYALLPVEMKQNIAVINIGHIR